MDRCDEVRLAQQEGFQVGGREGQASMDGAWMMPWNFQVVEGSWQRQRAGGRELVAGPAQLAEGGSSSDRLRGFAVGAGGGVEQQVPDLAAWQPNDRLPPSPRSPPPDVPK